jgi:chemotaxis protein histidine kinase CheA
LTGFLQDFEHSINLLPVAMSLFTQVCPWVSVLNSSQDGASNYGDGFRLAYPRILEFFGVRGGFSDTPETGAGKDAEDQDFRQCQAAFRAFWNAGADILSATDCADAADKLQGPERGKINRVVTFERGLAPKPLDKFIEGKSYRWHHQYDETETYIGTIVHRYAGVGSEGKFYSRAEIDAAWPTLDRLTEMCASLKAPHEKSLEKVVLARKRLPCEREGEAAALTVKRLARQKRKRAEENAAIRAEHAATKFRCDIGGCLFTCLTDTGLRRHVMSCPGRFTRADKELAAEALAPADVVRSMLDLDGTSTVERDWSRGRPSHLYCMLVPGEKVCSCSVHWELPIGWATHAANPSSHKPHSPESIAFLEKLFVGNARTESGEAERLMKEYFNGGVGLSYEHRKTRKQCKAWFGSRAKKVPRTKEQTRLAREHSAMLLEDKLARAILKEAAKQAKAAEKVARAADLAAEKAAKAIEKEAERAAKAADKVQKAAEKAAKAAEQAAEKAAKAAEQAAEKAAKAAEQAAEKAAKAAEKEEDRFRRELEIEATRQQKEQERSNATERLKRKRAHTESSQAQPAIPLLVEPSAMSYSAHSGRVRIRRRAADGTIL